MLGSKKKSALLVIVSAISPTIGIKSGHCIIFQSFVGSRTKKNRHKSNGYMLAQQGTGERMCKTAS
jgi:hypothetical protein